MKSQVGHKRRGNAVLICLLSLFVLVLFSIVIVMNIKNSNEQMAILEESIQSQLLSISIAAREMIDVDALDSYNSEEDVQADAENYQKKRAQFRQLAVNTDADFIYVLKRINGEYLFVFDSDPADEEIFIPYDVAQVHLDAFSGKESAGIMNVVDMYGSFNTGAVPIWKDGRVIGIICADIQDTFIKQSMTATRLNLTILISLLVFIITAMLVTMIFFIRRISHMQRELERMAHYDALTGLPNRKYLLDYLALLTQGEARECFALFFIDLDNFKLVNDQAGHDAGDELLAHVAKFLDNVEDEQSMSFRPASGILNIAARMGGDEFIQVVSGIENFEQAEQYAKDLMKRFQATVFDRYIEKYQVGLSIGAALYPYHSDNLHVLIKYADIAMYRSKKDGKNMFSIYADEMRDM